MDRFSEYRVMWVLVLFDLPTETKKDKKAYADFRMCITDKQFGQIELFYGKKPQGVKTPGQQLELF